MSDQPVPSTAFALPRQPDGHSWPTVTWATAPQRSGDPERVVALEAADIAVLKVQPLGGVRRCLELAERLGLPVVVSSALESSVGLRAGVALAACLE